VQDVRTSVVVRGVALTVIGFPLASCGQGVLAPHGPIGAAELTILFDATAIMIAFSAPPFEVDVVSLDWKWLFIYPNDGVASVNRLVVPVGRPVHFRLTSTSVMNSFFVPELGSQIYTMPGMTTQLNLLADQAGVYKGFSAQFSGDGFSDMRFETAAFPADQFAQWIERTKAGGRPLDAAAYAVLARPSEAVAPATYAPVAEGLFATISAGTARPPRQEH
jgi:cytochrome o ubiquinol oxidase subunit 2